jgi:acyl dehydratase
VGPYWENFTVGDRASAPWGRTITDAHVLAFSGLGGDFQHLHVDDEYARRSPYGRRIAHGQLTAVVSQGIEVSTGVWRHALAVLEERHRYLAPVFIGDTLSCELEVVERREVSDRDRGVVRFANHVSTQTGTRVCESEYVFLIARRGS